MQGKLPQQLNEALFDHLPAGVVVHDAHSAIVAANRLALELLGRDMDQMLGKFAHDPHWQFIHPDESKMAVDEFPATRVMASRGPVANLVLGVLDEAGALHRWLICNAYPVLDAGGELEAAVVCFTDCTALKRTETALRNSEKRLQLVLRGSDDGWWDWDLVAKKIYYSPRWWQMLGYEPDALPAGPDLWSSLLADEDRIRVQDFLSAALSGSMESYAIEFSLRHRDGHLIPVVSKGFIARDATGKAVRISGSNVDLTERKSMERRLVRSANYDYLTELPNRRYLQQELSHILARSARTGTHGALVLIDLDHFKTLNDTEGHALGDMLLRQVAERLLASMRSSDFIARLGGDEFVVIVDAAAALADAAASEAQQVCLKLADALGRPYRLGASAHVVTPSIGATLFDARMHSPNMVLKQADIALYEAKSEGRNTARFFDHAMQHKLEQRAQLDGELRKALQLDQFEVYLQPQFDVRRRVTGAEALLRWRHPVRGLLTPLAFIEHAESVGLVVPIGDWVLRVVGARLAAWRGDAALGAMSISVNISARQLRQPDFAQRVLALLAEAGAPPQLLVLELTETMIAENVEQAIATMEQLEQGGVTFAIDDFGTGFSSLRYIHRFPLRCLKIDQSFVFSCDSDPRSAAIVEIVIALSNKLGLENIAEGVETPSQLAFLEGAGCKSFQGYLLSRPLPIEQFESAARGQWRP